MEDGKPLFTWYRIIVIIIIIAILIGLIFPLVYNALSGKSNQYTEGLKYFEMKINQCVHDTDCHPNSYCYIGKCVCLTGWTGESCNIACPASFTANCSISSDCTYNGTTRGECYFGKCVCEPGYKGITCNLERRDYGVCLSTVECNGGVCVLTPPSFLYGECYCPENTINWNCIPI